MRRSYLELGMACLLLICFYYLSKEAAITSSTLIYQEAEIENEERKTEVKEKKAKEKKTKEKIVIDPGHGGMDPGMIGIGGAEEKKYNLEIALRVKEQLEKDGYSVVMTRDSDKGLYDDDSQKKKAQDMQRRIALIAEEKPVLSVSIHQNSYGDENVCGPQVFYYADSVEGEALAKYVQEHLNEIPGVLRKREIKGNRSYYLLKRSPSVMIIVECGFLTNPKEAEALKTDEYQEVIAEAVKAGIQEYLERGKAKT